MKQMANTKKFWTLLLGTLSITLLIGGCKGPATVAIPSATTRQGPLADPGTAGMSVMVDKNQASAGSTFTVNIVINTAIAARGAQCGLSYDAEALECLGVVEGSFFSDWAKPRSCSTIAFPSEPEVDNFKGRVASFGVAIMGRDPNSSGAHDPGGATGKGVFCSYEFKAKPGVNKDVTIDLTEVAISNIEALDIRGITTKNGQITIAP